MSHTSKKVSESRTVLRTHLWLEDDGRMLFGRGRAQLLELVRLLGSLNRAAKALGMSYRAAWGRIKSTEEVLGQPLLVKSNGRRGHELTPLAERLLESFARWQSEVEAFALERASQAFPWEMQPYIEKDDAPVGKENAPERPVRPDAGGDDTVTGGS